MLRNNMGLFLRYVSSVENCCYFYTSLSPQSIQITNQSRRMSWLVQEARLRALFANIIKVTSEDEWPPDMMVFLSHICRERTQIPNEFLLPFEIKMLSILKNPEYEKDEDSDDNRKILVVSCFLIVKVLISKMFFKPYRIA